MCVCMCVCVCGGELGGLEVAWKAERGVMYPLCDNSEE